MSKVNTNFGGSIATVIVVGVLVVVINSAIGSATKGGPADMSEAAVAERISPVGQLNTGEAVVPEQPAAEEETASAGGSRSGQEVYDSACMACHASGAAGAPKMGDTAAWAPRIDQGMETLMDHAINGLNAMPPRGTCGDCSDDELQAAIEYMVESSQ